MRSLEVAFSFGILLRRGRVVKKRYHVVKKENQPAPVRTPKQVFYLPEYGKSVEAESLEEAIKLVNGQSSQTQEEKEDK